MSIENINTDFETFSDSLERVIFHHLDIAQKKAHGEKGLVIAINAKWGMGKTTFLNWFRNKVLHPVASTNQPTREPGYIYLHDYKKIDDIFGGERVTTEIKLQCKEPVLILSYNAWENDNFDDPFTSLIGQFYQQLKNIDVPQSMDFLATSTKILTTVGKISLKLIPENTMIGQLIKQTKEVITEKKDILNDLSHLHDDLNKKMFDDKLKSFEFLEEEKKQFKNTLETLGKDEHDNNPIKLIMIDEIDRCNPIFAVKLLEFIKHYFEAKNCVFLITTDKVQLEAIIKKVYGESFDAEHYLSRFFDFEFSLPVSDNFNRKFAQHHGIAQKLRFADVINDMITSLALSPREQVKVFKYAELLEAIPPYNRPEMFLLMPLKVHSTSQFNKVLNFSPLINSIKDIADGFKQFTRLFNIDGIDPNRHILTSTLWSLFMNLLMRQNIPDYTKMMEEYAEALKDVELKRIIKHSLKMRLSQDEFKTMLNVVVSLS